MAHELNIEMVNGNEQASFICVKENTWHGLGTFLDESPTFDQIKAGTHLDRMHMSKVPLQYMGTDGSMKTMEDKYVIKRDYNDQAMGVVGKNYTIFQTEDAMKLIDDTFGKELDWSSVGILQNGAKYFGTLTLKKNNTIEIVKNDPVKFYLAFYSSHDGIMSFSLGLTPTRIVCANTLRMAMNNELTKMIRVKHGKDVAANAKQVADLVNMTRLQFEATADQFKMLTMNTGINQNDIARYVKEVFEFRKPETELVALRQRALTERIQHLFESGRGQENPLVKGTPWAAYNAVTEYLTHDKKGNENIGESLFGTINKVNQRAYDLAMDMVRVAA